MAYTQDNQYFKVNSPLGKDKLLFRRVSGSEGLSELFQYEVEAISESADLDFSKVVGKAMTVTLGFANKKTRYIHALVERFEQTSFEREPEDKKQFAVYRATLRPWLWVLTLTRNCQIFQNLSAVEIITKVFDDLGFKDYKNSLKSTYEKRDYCVQYDETAFDFVSRLMEDEGIYYFFEHTESKHTLVLADDLSAHQAIPEYKSDGVLFWPGILEERPEDVVYQCSLSESVTTQQVAVDDYHFETPQTDLLSLIKGKAKTSTMRVYEYQNFQGGFDKKAQGDKIAKKRIESLEWHNRLLRGKGYGIAFIAGGKFTLKEHPRKDINKEYVLRRVSLEAYQTDYHNSFEAIPATIQFRAPRLTRKPRISGTQTAVVTGKKGEEIWTDKYGRIKVQFHWDQEGKLDENTTCWIRVNQSWAGKAWGRLFLPRIGQEVVVSFINGDPDRPLVTGAVYNAEQTVPYALPANQTKSTWKTRSSKGGKTEDFNEIYFEDKKGEEKFYMHAQKDMKIMVEHDRHKRVDNDEINDIKMNRTTTIEEKDDKLTVAKGNRTVTIKLARTTTVEEKDDTLTVGKGSRIITIKEKDYKLEVSKGNREIKVNKGKETHYVKSTRSVSVDADETHTNKKNFTHTVKGNYTLKVTGNLTLDVKGNIVLKGAKNLTGKAGMNMTLQAGMNMTSKAGMNMTTKAGLNMTNQAGLQMTNKAGLTMMNKAGLQMTNKAGVMLTNDGGVLLTDKAGALGTVKAGAILMVKGALIMIGP